MLLYPEINIASLAYKYTHYGLINCAFYIIELVPTVYNCSYNFNEFRTVVVYKRCLIRFT